MLNVGRAAIAGGFALALGLQSIVGVTAAPRHVSQPKHALTLGAAAGRSGAGSPVGSAPTSLGHFYGKEVSNFAHIVPAGPQHGTVISAFATSSNPSHTKGHRHPHPVRSGSAR